MRTLTLWLASAALAQDPPSAPASEAQEPAPTEIGSAPDDAPAAPDDASAAPSRAVDPAVLLGAPAGPPLEGDALRAQTLETARLLRCVVCQGLSVADSPSETARAMRDEVEQLVAQGYDTDQVLTYFEASYGEFVRLEPKSEGFGAVVWIAPVAVLIGGAALIGRSVRRRPHPPIPASPAEAAAATPDGLPLADPSDPYLRRVREETA